MLSGFKQFILRGNVIDMAVGVVIGAAFAGVVGSFTKDILTPFVAAIVGKPDFSYIGFTIGSTAFPVGDFINALLGFLIIALVVYYFVVLPVQKLMDRYKPEPVAAPAATRECPYCLSKVPVEASKCAFCTSELPAAAMGMSSGM